MTRALIFAVSLFLVFAQKDLCPEMTKQVTRLIKPQKSWGAATGTHGVSVNVREDKRIPQPPAQADKANHPPARYLMYSTGLPKDKLYQLSEVNFPSLNPELAMEGIGLNSHGLAVCPGKPGICSSEEGPDDPIHLILPSAKG
jgi:hypothetical protein